MGVVPYRRMPMRGRPVGRLGGRARVSRRAMARPCARHGGVMRAGSGVLRPPSVTGRAPQTTARPRPRHAVSRSRRGRAVMACRRGSPPDRCRPGRRVPATGGRRSFDEPDRGDGDHHDDGACRCDRGPPRRQAEVGQPGTSRAPPPCPGPRNLIRIERGALDGRVNRARALAPEVIRCRHGGVVRVVLLSRSRARSNRDEILQRPDPVARKADDVLRSVFALAFHGHGSNPFLRILQSLSQSRRHRYVSRCE
jgi:hypothetical protein